VLQPSIIGEPAVARVFGAPYWIAREQTSIRSLGRVIAQRAQEEHGVGTHLTRREPEQIHDLGFVGGLGDAPRRGAAPC
jgi:hypothetical protein